MDPIFHVKKKQIWTTKSKIKFSFMDEKIIEKKIKCNPGEC